jgi:hypothetical protein
VGSRRWTTSERLAGRSAKFGAVAAANGVCSANAAGGEASVRAISGSAGLALLVLLLAGSAQASVQISSAATKNMSCSAGVCTPTAKDAVLNVDDLTNMLTAGDVEVRTGKEAVTIGVFSPVSWTSARHLTLKYSYNLNIRAAITVAGSGGISIVHIPTLKQVFADGGLEFFPGGRIAFWDVSSSLIIDGQAYTLFRSIQELKELRRGSPRGHFALADNYDAGAKRYTASPIHEFEGTLEGLGNTISNLTIDGRSEYIGFIGEHRGLVRDLALENAE